jgi:phosphoheptose isomerase
MARSRGLKVVSFTGFTGGELKSSSDLNIHVPTSNYGTIEDVHQMIMHIVAQYTYLRDLR